MNSSLFLPIMDERVSVIEIEFSPNADQSYRYKCDFRVRVGDIVVVESRNWFAVARVTAVDLPVPVDAPENINFRWAVTKVNEGEHNDRLDHEKSVIERVNALRANAMREQLLGALGLTKQQATELIDSDVVDDEEKEHKE